MIPVLDLLGGLAVHARRGDRANYRPVTSMLAPGTPDPLALAQALRRAGYPELYMADLDAICGTGCHLDVVSTVVRTTGQRVLLDAGLRRATDARNLMAAGAAAIIAGSETLGGWADLEALVREYGPERVIFSLDLRGGAVMADNPQLGAANPEQILATATGCGVQTALLLELAAVGSEGGPPLGMARRLLQAVPSVELLVGGGVRDAADLARLAGVGVAGALVATALHNGRLATPAHT